MAITKENIPKTNIKELIDNTIIQSATLAMIDFRDLIKVNPNFTYYKIMSRILIQALERHERVCPLFKRTRILFGGHEHTFVDNFDAFLEGKVTEEYTTLVPKTVYNIDTSLLHTRRSWRYDMPVMRNTYRLGLQFVDYITSYPYRFYEDKEADDFTNDSYIYYIPLYDGKSQDRFFKKTFYFELLSYLKSVKNNIRYPDMPMELMMGIEEEYQILNQEVTEFYRKASSHGRLWR